MKIFKSLQASIDFSTRFLIISLASGGPPGRPTNGYFQIFSKFSLNFRENFDKILKDFSKIRKISFKIFTIENFSLIFKILKPFGFEKG